MLVWANFTELDNRFCQFSKDIEIYRTYHYYTMGKISLSAIIKNTTGYEHKVFNVECNYKQDCYGKCTSDCIYWSSIKETLQDIINKEPDCVLFNSNADFCSEAPLIINDPKGKIEVKTGICGNYIIEIDEGAFCISSLFHGSFLHGRIITAKECALILNKIDKNGLLVFVKDYLGMIENELKQLQALGKGCDETTIKRMAFLIEHVSCIKQWLYLNNYN